MIAPLRAKPPMTLAALLDVRACRALSFGGDELFALDDRALQIAENVIMIFRYADLRKIGSSKIATNLPAEIALRTAFFEPLGVSDDDLRYGEVRRMVADSFFNAALEKHQRLKPVFAKALMPQRMQPFSASARMLAAELFDEMKRPCDIEFCDDFANALVFRLWADIFGMTEAETVSLRTLMIGMNPVVSPGVIDQERLDRLNTTIPQYIGFWTGILARNDGHVPFVTEISSAYATLGPNDDMPRSWEAMTALSMIDGFDALAAAASACIHALLTFPNALDAIKGDRALIGRAVSEALRLFGPVRMIARYASADLCLDEWVIPEGTVMIMNWGAGGRDPTAFPNPLDFDLDREERPLPSFGGGRQVCPGQNLVRSLCQSLLEALVDTDVRIGRAGPPSWEMVEPLSFNAKLSRLPLTIR